MTKTRLSTLLCLFSLGTLASLATAAPAAEPSGPAPAACPKLTAEQCEADSRWSSVAYCSDAPSTPAGMSKCTPGQAKLAKDPCTIKQAAACKEIVKTSMKADPVGAKAPTSMVLKVDGENIPKDLRKGRKRSTYSKPKPGRELAVAGKNVIARSGLTRAPGYKQPPPTAATAHRKPAWDTNGEKIESCREFAYEELYDGMRYIDAVGACAGDRACEVEIAYMTKTPGIARRTLKRKDGKPIERQLNLRTEGTFVKNDLFVARRDIAFAVDPVVDVKIGADGKRHHARTAEMDAVADALDEGRQWYSFGCTSGCGTRKFKNEWDFHDKLRERNKLSKAEFAEYERRKAEFRELHENWIAAAKIAIAQKKANKEAMDKRKNKPLVSKVSRLDMVSSDPFERVDLMNESVVSLDGARAKAGAAKADLPNAGQQQAYGHYRGRAPAVTSVLAAPAAAPATANPGKKRPGIVLPHCSPAHWTTLGRDPNMDDLHFGGPASCALADFLKEEYRRKAAGQKSCLDLGNDDCDWSPETFHGRFVASFPYGDRLHVWEDYCERWTGGTMDRPNLDAAEKYIKKMKKKIGAAIKEIGPYRESTDAVVDGEKLWKVGSDWVDAQSFGDKDWFAAGYDYDVGWHVHPIDLSPEKKVCDLTGSAHGNFGIDAWLLGADVDVVEASSHFRTNVANDGITHFDARLQILNEDLFPDIDANFTTAWAPKEPLGGEMDLPEIKPSITIMAGPVPVTGSAWGSIFYDAVISADAKVTKANGGCKPKNVEFMIQGMVEPQLGVAGYLEVGAGISGLLSAGIRGSLTLVSLGLPLRTKLEAKNILVEQNSQPAMTFNTSLDLAVSTMSGYIALYIEILFWEDEWELFSWSGVSDEVALMSPPLSTELPLLGWPR